MLPFSFPPHKGSFREKLGEQKHAGTFVPSQNFEGKYVSNCQKCWEKFFLWTTTAFSIQK